jgi:hypothetical protein
MEEEEKGQFMKEKSPGERSATVEARRRSSRRKNLPNKILFFQPKMDASGFRPSSSFHRPSVGEKCSVIGGLKLPESTTKENKTFGLKSTRFLVLY